MSATNSHDVQELKQQCLQLALTTGVPHHKLTEIAEEFYQYIVNPLGENPSDPQNQHCHAQQKSGHTTDSSQPQPLDEYQALSQKLFLDSHVTLEQGLSQLASLLSPAALSAFLLSGLKTPQ